MASKLSHSSDYERIRQTVNQTSAIFTVTCAFLLFSGNVLGYYLWSVVKSAYKIIKEENKITLKSAANSPE